MFRIIVFTLAVFIASPSFAQTTPSDGEIAKAWEKCSRPGQEAQGALAAQLKGKGQSTWRSGLEGCEAVKQAYLKSKAGIDAKNAADAAAAEKSEIDALAARLNK